MIEAGDLENWPALVLYPDGTKGEAYNTSTRRWENSESDDNNTVYFSIYLFHSPFDLYTSLKFVLQS
jgi:homocysteine S-methyltransferase